jgi:hypothetical protein
LQEYHLKNKPVIKQKIPIELFNKLKQKVFEYKDKDNKLLGLHGNPPKHVFFKNFELLDNYIKTIVQYYFNNYQIFNSFTNKKFKLIVSDLWINFQKKGQFINRHKHSGLFSYNIWIKIPFDYRKEIEQRGMESATFEFTYTNIIGELVTENINLTKNDEGTIIFFPSQLIHQVYPFFTSDEERISIAGNVMIVN